MTNVVSIAQSGANNVTMRNRLINGGMVIDQRNAGALVTTPTTATFVYTVDRWAYYVNAASKFTVQRTPSATETGYANRVGAGFTNYLAMTSTSAYTPASTDIMVMTQVIEGFNFADMAWGTANAKAVTLSFWAYSSLTGTHSGVMGSVDGTSYPFTFSIPTANTWTQISVTIAGSTSGSWPTSNTAGAYLFFNMGCGSTKLGTAGAWSATPSYGVTGSVSVVGTNGATFYITGVQLEKGSTATPFEQRLYGTELALCQRYYQQLPSLRDGTTLVISNFMPNNAERIPMPVLPVQMRAVPTVVSYRVAGTNAGEITEFSAGTNRVVSSYQARDACGGGYLQCATAFANPAILNLTYSAEL